MSSSTKTAILHMGLHKTASSSIQASLWHNREYLATHGYFYPGFRFNKKAYYNHSIPLYGLFSDSVKNHPNYIQKDWNPDIVLPVFRKHFDNCLLTKQNLILSGEDISAFDEKNLDQMKSILETNGFKIRPLIFVRESISDFISRTQQRIKGRQNITIEQLISEYKNEVIPIITKLKRVFSEIEFYNFDEAINFEGGPVAYFFNLLNLEIDKCNIHKVNESLSAPTIRLLNYLNGRTPYLYKGQINFTRHAGDTRPLRGIKGAKFTVLKNEIAPLYEQLCQERVILEQEIGKKFSITKKELCDFPDFFSWEERSINSLIDIFPRLREGLLYRIYDYFFELFKLKQLSYYFLTKIGKAIDNCVAAQVSALKVKE